MKTILLILFLLAIQASPALAQGGPDDNCPCGADKHGECLPCEK